MEAVSARIIKTLWHPRKSHRERDLVFVIVLPVARVLHVYAECRRVDCMLCDLACLRSSRGGEAKDEAHSSDEGCKAGHLSKDYV